MVTNSEAKDTGDCAFLAFCPGPAANLGFQVAGETLPRPQPPRQPRPGATWSARQTQTEAGRGRLSRSHWSGECGRTWSTGPSTCVCWFKVARKSSPWEPPPTPTHNLKDKPRRSGPGRRGFWGLSSACLPQAEG